ncbi:MAG: DUF2798 domain-containing protein [Eubacteriaceae bacterium]
MFTKKAFSFVLIFWFALFLSTGMSLAFAYINLGFIPFPGILTDILLGLVIAYIAGIFVPITKYANSFATLFNAKEGSMPFTLLTTFIYAVYFSIVMGFAFTVIGEGLPNYFMQAFIHGIPLGFVIGYLMALIVTPLCIWLTNKMTNKPMSVDKEISQ